jgi:hypothetical protein
MNYTVHVEPQYLQQLIRFRCGSHALRIELGRWTKPVTERSQRVCQLCEQGVEHELHFVMSCPAYQQIRTEYEEALFHCVGGSAMCAEATAEQMRLFLDQPPKLVAEFLGKCFAERQRRLAAG